MIACTRNSIPASVHLSIVFLLHRPRYAAFALSRRLWTFRNSSFNPKGFDT